MKALSGISVALLVLSLAVWSGSYARQKDAAMVDASAPVPVRVLTQEGCVNTPPTIDKIKRIALELKVAIALEKIFIKTPEDADNHHFKGSPTVLINSLDLDPAMRSGGNYGFT